MEIMSPLSFVSTHIDLGEQWSGENSSLTYAYEVNFDTRIKEIKTNCGCFSAVLLVSGRAVDLPYDLKSGDGGEISAQFRSAGFSGRKLTGLEIVFSEKPSMALTAEVLLKKWFEIEPKVYL